MDLQALKQQVKRRVPALSPSNPFAPESPRRGSHRRPQRAVAPEPNAFALAAQRLAGCQTDDALREATTALLDSAEWRRALAHQRIFMAGVFRALEQSVFVEKLTSTEDQLPVPFAERITPAVRRKGQLTMLWTIKTTMELVQSGYTRPQLTTDEDAFSYLYDRTIPREVRQTLRLRDMSDAAFFALAATDLAAIALPQANIGCLYRAWTNNCARWFDYVATFFDIEVPNKLRLRVDWVAALMQHAAERSAATHAERGSGPFLVPVDDE